MANLTKSREQDIVNTFKEVSPTFWNLMTGIMKKSESLDGEHYAYFIVCRMAKLLSNNRLIPRAAKVGIYLDTQGWIILKFLAIQNKVLKWTKTNVSWIVSYHIWTMGKYVIDDVDVHAHFDIFTQS